MLSQNKAVLYLKQNWQQYLVVVVVLLITFLRYHRLENDFECGDLGLKIAGARLQAQHTNAYFYIAPSGDSAINGVISTPLLNTLHTPLIGFNSCQVKQFGFWFNFMLLFLSLVFAIQLTASTFWARLYILAAALLVCFILAKPFVYNLAYGQIYLLFALIFFLLLFLLKKNHYLLLGLLWSFAVAIRPIFLAGGILILLYFNRKIIMGLVVGALAVLLFTIATGTLGYWKEYSAAMKLYATQLPARYHFGNYNFNDTHLVSTNFTFIDCTGILPPGKQIDMRTALPGTIMQPLQFWLMTQKTAIINASFYSAIAAILSLIVAFCIRFRLTDISPEKYILTIFILYLICELCIPAPRGPYSFVLWFFAVALIIAKGNVVETAVMLFGLAVFYHMPHLNNKLSEVYMIAACLMFILRKSEKPYYMQWLNQLRLNMPIGNNKTA